MVLTERFQHEEVLGIKFGYHPFAKPSMFTYIYFIDGLLIDTGQSRARKKILQETASLGIDQILLTHYHEDHTGNVDVIKAKHNCPVYASALCCDVMKNPPRISLAQKLTWGDRNAYLDILPIAEAIQTKKFRFEIIPIPGHAPDMVALYEPQKKWLFSADLYINSYISFFMDNESIAQQIESIRSILQLDFDTMFCSHNPKLTNARASLNKKLSFLESTFEQVAKLHSQGYSDSEIFRALKLKENRITKFLSGGHLSKLNMVRAIIRDIESTKQ